MDATTYIWVIYFIGFDDKATGGGTIEPRVAIERIVTTTDAAEQHDDANFAALVRGGQLLAFVDQDDERNAKELAEGFKKDIFRMR